MKQKLNLAKAKTFAKRTFSKNFKGNRLDWMIKHSKIMEKLTDITSTTNINKEIVKQACWLHDIGRISNDKKHSEESIKILEKRFIVPEKLKDCIINHSPGKNPKTKEGKIIQILDKLSSFDPESTLKWMENEMKTKKDFKWMENYFNNALKNLYILVGNYYKFTS